MDGMGGVGVGVDDDEAEDKAEAEAVVAAASPGAAESGEAEARDVNFSAERLEVERYRRRIIEGGWDWVRTGGGGHGDGSPVDKANDERACGWVDAEERGESGATAGAADEPS
jgi:hypothetical protein